MEKLFDDNLELTSEAIKIQDEFESLIKPYFKKYSKKYNPIEFEWVINSAISMCNNANYVETIVDKRLENNKN